MLSPDQLFSLIVACIAVFAVLLCLWQMQQVRRLRRDLDELRSQQGETQEAQPEPADFSASLDAVERQQLQTSQPASPPNTVDKYRYVGALAEQGLDAKGIAEALQMPPAEVEQLLQLSKLRQAGGAK